MVPHSESNSGCNNTPYNFSNIMRGRTFTTFTSQKNKNSVLQLNLWKWIGEIEHFEMVTYFIKLKEIIPIVCHDIAMDKQFRS